jgi:hypothetical protein
MGSGIVWHKKIRDRWILGEAFDRAFFEIGCRAFWAESGRHHPGRWEIGIEIAGRRESPEENRCPGGKFGQGKKKNTYLIMLDPICQIEI